MLLWFVPIIIHLWLFLRMIQIDVPLNQISLTVHIIECLCLIFGTVGFLISLIFTTKPSQKAVNAYGPIPNMPEGFGNICPNCETALPEIAVFCPACGTRVKAEVTKEQPPAQSQAEEVSDTEGETQTGNNTSTNDEQISDEIPETKLERPDNAAEEKASGTIWKAIIAIVVLVVVCGIGNYLTKDSSSEATKTTTSTEATTKTDHMSEECRQLLEAARRGDAEAQNSLGVHYHNGDGVEKDSSVAAYWIRKAADQGDVTAQRNIGILYLNGDGVRKNAVSAVEWLTKAADQGSPEAMELLAECYEKGLGVEVDWGKAIRLRVDAATERARQSNP